MNAETIPTPPTTTTNSSHHVSLTTFTCNTCQKSFADSNSQRSHFKSDSHIQKLRQRDNEQPSEPERGNEDFSLDQSAQQKTGSDDDKPDGLKTAKSTPLATGSSRTTRYDLDADSYSRPAGQRTEHVHESVTEQREIDTPFSSAAAIQPIEFDTSRCLLCNKLSSNLEENLSHMGTLHGLSIPFKHKLIDLETFIQYLYTIVVELNECLYCAISKGSVRGVQQHMLSKEHFKLGTTRADIQVEYLDFYEEESGSSDDGSDSDIADIAQEDAIQPEARSNTNLALHSNDEKQHEVTLDSGRTIRRRPHKNLSYPANYNPTKSRTSRHQDIPKTIRGAPESKPRMPTSGPVQDTESDEALAADNESQSNVLSVQSDTTGPSNPQPSHALSFRPRKNDEKGLIGVSEWQRKALISQEVATTRSVARKESHFKAGLQRMNERQRKDVKRLRRRRQRVPESI